MTTKLECPTCGCIEIKLLDKGIRRMFHFETALYDERFKVWFCASCHNEWEIIVSRAPFGWLTKEKMEEYSKTLNPTSKRIK